MQKNDYISVSIKIFGVFLIVLAIQQIPQFFASLVLYANVENVISHSDSTVVGDSMMRAASATAKSGITKSSLSFLVYVFCGVYFIRSGKLFFRLFSENPKEI